MTPSWADINCSLTIGHRPFFFIFSSCVWEVWTRRPLRDRVLSALREQARREKEMEIEPYPFERYYDEAGYHLWPQDKSWEPILWEIKFYDNTARKPPCFSGEMNCG